MAVKKVAVYIGRFQPLHNGHTHIIDAAIQGYDALIVLVGSSGEARQPRNPFSFEERSGVIFDYIRSKGVPLDGRHFSIKPIYNFLYNNAKWIQYVQETVNRSLVEMDASGAQVTIVGSDRDDTTWYVHAFPQWKQQLFPKVPDGMDLSATAIRNIYFGDPNWIVNSWQFILEGCFETPSVTAVFLKEFAQTEAYAKLKREFDNAEDYKAAWAVAPYPPIFVTTDSVIIQSGHLLVIVRGALPGEGLWALPGGFLKPRLRLRQNAVEEIMEETGIRLADGKRSEELTRALLDKAIVGSQTFDDPDRSSRGRTVTTAFLIRLDDTKPLPKVHGMFAPLEDTGGVEGVVETSNAMWVPISEARNRREMWFEDHWSILDVMLGMVKDN